MGDQEPRRRTPLRAEPLPPGAPGDRAGRSSPRRARRLGALGTAVAAAALWGLTAVTLGGGEAPTPSSDLATEATGDTAADGSTSTSTSGPTTTATSAPAPATETTLAGPAPAAVAPPPSAPPAVAPPATTAPRTRTTLPGSGAPSSGGQRTAAAPSGAPVIGRISIPRLGLDTTLYEGGELAQIDRGPSHMPTTVMPGRQGNTVVAGHRTTKTHPFRDLDLLSPGDTVSFEMPYGTYTYEFTHHQVVTEDDVWILQQGSGYVGALFACHPKGSDQYRLVAHLRLTSTPAAPPTTTTTAPTAQPIGRLPGR